LQTQVQERERALPLRERIKEIFKKHGVTVTSILLAAGVTIGILVGTVTNVLKGTGTALGAGLKDIGAMIGSIVPGLIGQVGSFFFKTAGQVVGFLAEHTLAAVAFLFVSERIKEIFKKHGVTVTSILLAASVTIGILVGTVTNVLKATGKALGAGLKDIGATIGSILPGLIGQVASFLFKTAGQVVGFLAEHTWLLILAAVAFLFVSVNAMPKTATPRDLPHQ